MAPSVQAVHERRSADELKAKRRLDAHAKISKLIEAGVFESLKPGRKRLYEPEEALEVARQQRRESYYRRKERIHAAEALLSRAEVQE
jgi:hypothetical protein